MMENLNSEPSISKFLQELNNLGYQIQSEGDELIVKGTRNTEINEQLLNEIRKRKNTILEYLNLFEFKKNAIPIKKDLIENLIEYNGKSYYHLTPIQIYWVDNEIDKDYKEHRKAHGQIIIKNKISGEININTLILSITKLLERHESLRSTFHRFQDNYVMGINDLGDAPYIEYKDSILSDNFKFDDFIGFRDHQFNIERQVFLVRIIKKKENEHVLSMKIHHVIFDSWSMEILLRDFVKIYNAIKENIEPDLPILEYQYKDFISITNRNRKVNIHGNRAYWDHRFPQLPNRLIIPEAKPIKTLIKDKICQSFHLKLSDKNVVALKNSALKYNCSRFIILQALFNLYLFKKTGQKDIVIGTFVFGRDVIGSENQIGCFAKTVLLRSKLNEHDSFGDVIQKVTNANDEMNENNAFSLMEYMLEKAYPDKSLYGTHWKINMQYNETVGIINSSFPREQNIQTNSNRIDIQLFPFEEEKDYVFPIDMQLDFRVTKDSISLKTEYDSSIYDKQAIESFVLNYLESFDYYI